MAYVEQRSHKSGKTWRVVWRQADLPGRQQETFGDPKDAAKFKLMVQAAGERWPEGWVKRQGPADQADSTLPTFAQWAERTIAVRARANGRTRSDYQRDLRVHLLPTFGDLPLDRISREHVGQWLIGFRTAPLAATSRPPSAKTVNNVHGLASSIIDDAVRDGLLPRNVFRGAAGGVPNVRSEEMVFLTRPEFDVLHARIPEHYRTLALFLVLTGLRWSEATALTVSDVQLFGRPTVTVWKAWKRQPDHTFVLGEPKSRRSRRTIGLPDEAVEALIPLVAGRAGSERLFLSPMGQTVLNSNFRYRAWAPAVKLAAAEAQMEKQPRVHDLRHTHVAWLIEQGVDLVSIQRRLGHESIQTTIDRYGHLTPEADERINAALARLRTPQEPASVRENA